jgi:hypothetical protein
MIKVGDKNSKLEVTRIIDSTYISVKCDCGREKIVYRCNWKKIKSCGLCGRGLRLDVKPGDEFNFLTVIEEDGKLHHAVAWKCQCKCGNIVRTRGSLLYNGGIKSCGCHKLGQNNKGYRGYKELNGTLWNSIVKSAKKRNFEFSISIEDAWNKFIEQEGKCALSGLNLEFTNKSKNTRLTTASLDRIDSKKGYTVDNIQWIHKRIQIMKMDAKEEDFINFCYIISDFQRNKNEKYH